MKIELWSDFGCPFCYIGKTRFENALNKFEHKDEVEVIYKAYQLNPNAPKVMTEGVAESFAKGHRVSVEQAKQKFDMFVNAAKAVGLTYDYVNIKLTNTFDAHRLAKWANQFGLEHALTSRLMKAYFTDALNLANHTTLLDLAKEVGLDVKKAEKMLSSNQYTDQVNAEILEGRQVGVQGVPFFVLNRKYAVSGAQQEDYFLAAFNQLWLETNPLDTFEGADNGHVCNDEGCSI